MTYLSPVSNHQNSQVWNPTQNKPVVSQEQFNSTLSRAGEFGEKDKPSCISRFFGSIFGAIKSFFRFIFCIGSSSPKLNVKIENNYRAFTMKVGEKTQTLVIEISEKDGKKVASRICNSKYEVNETFINQVKEALAKEGVDEISISFGSKNPRHAARAHDSFPFSTSKYLYSLGFVPDTKEEVDFATKSLIKWTKNIGNVPKLKDAVSKEISNLEKENDEAAVKVLGEIVGSMIGSLEKLEKLADIKKVWDPKKVKTSFKIKQDVLLEAAFLMKGLAFYRSWRITMRYDLKKEQA